jgi:hypothetical protein
MRHPEQGSAKDQQGSPTRGPACKANAENVSRAGAGVGGGYGRQHATASASVGPAPFAHHQDAGHALAFEFGRGAGGGIGRKQPKRRPIFSNYLSDVLRVLSPQILIFRPSYIRRAPYVPVFNCTVFGRRWRRVSQSRPAALAPCAALGASAGRPWHFGRDSAS